ELRAHIHSELSEQAAARAQEQAELEIVGAAVSGSKVSLPDRLLEYEAQRGRDRLARNLESYGMSAEQYNRLVGRSEDEMEQSLHAQAETALRRELVLQAIAAKEDLSITDEELEERIGAAVAADGGDAKMAARLRQDRAVRQRVRASMLEEKAAQWLVNHVLGAAATNPAKEAKPQ
ncbi:MAG: hypothetical protein HY534_02225, partial [Chloroflexi bacterium]|nr:hypothetical protein [Chloroflexota bacterium]